MRIIVVGRATDRARLRVQLNEARIDIVGEFETLAEARRSSISADGIILAGRSSSAGDDVFGESLTPREIEVLQLLAEGLPNKAIGDRLGISDQTVKFHVASICGKLGASNRTEAVRKALRKGWITL